MAPLRTELSTVSLPPRERIMAKRCARAMKHGQPVTHTGANGAKRTARVPPPTLAATRERRTGAMNVAYLNLADGYHVKRVVRRPATPDHVPSIPYLEGQDDIPRSESEESDSESNDGTVTMVLEADLPPNTPVADVDMGADAGELPTQLEDIDYDAEGEDDEAMEDCTGPSLNSHTFGAAWDHGRFASAPQMWPTVLTPPSDLIGSASEEDRRALFDGLDRFPTDFQGFPADFPSDFPTTSLQDVGGNAGGPGYFAMHQLHAVVDDLQRSTPPSIPLDSLSWPSPLFARSQPSTPVPAICPPAVLSSPFTRPSPLLQYTTQPASHVGAPINTSGLLCSPKPARQTPRSSTRDLVARARSQAQSSSLVIPQQPPIPNINVPNGPLLRVPPLRKSLSLPDFLHDDEHDNSSSDEDRSRPSTPISYDNTDIGLNESSPPPPPVTQARSRAVRYFNVDVHSLPHRQSGPSRIPKVLQLQVNAAKVYRFSSRRRRNRDRHPSTTGSARSRNILTSAALTPEQRTIITQMEFHVLKDVFCTTPWPDPELRAIFLADAERYSSRITGVSGDEVFTPPLMDTVFRKMSGDRGNPLAKIEYMMEHAFKLETGNKQPIYKLMEKDLFLFPSLERNPSEYFCVDALGSALEIILFKSSKSIGVAFMEELCQPDDAEKCAHWHRRLCDRTARRGVPPGLLALAATQMYWALEKLYMGSKVAFDEQHYRAVWDRYFRALLRLPHLSRLRVDMLDRIKAYYMAHWPAEEPFDDEESFPAW